MSFSSQHKSMTQKIEFVVDDLWNDNRMLKQLLKIEVGATRVSFGKARPTYTRLGV